MQKDAAASSRLQRPNGSAMPVLHPLPTSRSAATALWHTKTIPLSTRARLVRMADTTSTWSPSRESLDALRSGLLLTTARNAWSPALRLPHVLRRLHCRCLRSRPLHLLLFRLRLRLPRLHLKRAPVQGNSQEPGRYVLYPYLISHEHQLIWNSSLTSWSQSTGLIQANLLARCSTVPRVAPWRLFSTLTFLNPPPARLAP